MFDQFAQELLRSLPQLPELSPEDCRRHLSKAYFYILENKWKRESDNLNAHEITEVAGYLRRLADTLETVAVFDPLNGIDVTDEVVTASAFVAAESLSLLKSLMQLPISRSVDVFRNEGNYVSLEAGLLYMIGGYTVNAGAAVRDIIGLEVSAQSTLGHSSSELVATIKHLCEGHIVDIRTAPQLPHDTDERLDPGQLVGTIRELLYTGLTAEISSFLLWLGGFESEEPQRIITDLRRRMRLIGGATHTEFADIHHLCGLLIVAVSRIQGVALVHAVPEPGTNDEEFQKKFRQYLLSVARGTAERRGRPYLWPTAMEYIQNCLPGPDLDCVIAMPTGSGKSFVAELAIAHALSKGWTLYLAPTNALANQIRRDLHIAFREARLADVHTFIGGMEYSTLSDMDGTAMTSGVVVMTPEKCALALRLYPEAFSDCSLCIFDECHLLNDTMRGVTADVVLAELMNVAPTIRFLMMSAMVSNPEELADWLKNAHNVGAIPTLIKWRPSRTIRGLVLVDNADLVLRTAAARRQLDTLPRRRRHQTFEVPLALMVGLSGPWTRDGASDYLLKRLPVYFPAQVERGSNQPQFPSWKNTTSRLVSETLALAGIPTINFMLSSRHHAFSSAAKSLQTMRQHNRGLEELPTLVSAWLNIADAELGVPTPLRELLRGGVAVHTSAMLPVEQAASEWMFTQRHTSLMFATGTLAEGLNLPATAVVIAGTSLGNSGTINAVDELSRVNSLILNGFGRAGRPGFSNQGVGILVSDGPYGAPVGRSVDPTRVLDRYAVLGEPDAAINVHSPIEAFIQDMASGNFGPDSGTSAEWSLTSLLIEHGEVKAGGILSKTLGAYHAHRRQVEWLERAQVRIRELHHSIANSRDIPPWLNSVAALSGLDILRLSNMFEAYIRSGIPQLDRSDLGQLSLMGWADLFIGVIAMMTPRFTVSMIPEATLRSAGMDPESLIASDMPPVGWETMWQGVSEALRSFMLGASYADIARVHHPNIRGTISNSRSNGGAAIPSVFKLVKNTFEPLAIFAGGFVALSEKILFDSPSVIADDLGALPLAIRYGCHSVQTLSWFRFGFRQRVCAHALQAAFPIPVDMDTDEMRSRWVKRALRNFINEEAQDSLLESVRVVLAREE